MDIPFAQRSIIKVAINNATPCYIATNVLDSLIKGDIPTRAELNDIVGTLEMGAAGIVLAAETAIGTKPILCAEIVNELMHRFKLYNNSFYEIMRLLGAHHGLNTHNRKFYYDPIYNILRPIYYLSLIHI